ncbi:uncharacterized protein VTP21DRAFT_711 [Calcarisporiella thermophila]|uniref:uncharacterized protein n=1 Tax=Calcarisporiella thermophila TaxID=911321 RepID=UPI003741F1BA
MMKISIFALFTIFLFQVTFAQYDGHIVHPIEKGDGIGGYPLSGFVREYFIAAVELDWDYAPLNYDYMHGDQLESTIAKQFTENNARRIGKKYKKAVYRAYSDATFSTQLPHDPVLGLLGPTIRAETGDRVRVHFRNMASKPYSVHPHGVKYTLISEGALYMGTEKLKTAAVPPGETVTYVWDVAMRSAPGPNDPSSILYAYHSHVMDPEDIFAGLMGALIVYKPGMLDDTGKPTAYIDQEVIMALLETDENRSPYIDDNIQKYTENGIGLKSDAEFRASNFMANINGFIYNNLDGLVMRAGSRVRWYVFSLGSTFDMHTAHWDGNTVLYHGHRTDVVDLMPASFRTVDMIPDNVGKWLFHCHVTEHWLKGMSIYY